MDHVREEMRAMVARYRVKQKDVALRLEISDSALSAYLTGERGLPADLPARFHAAVLGLVEERRQADLAEAEARVEQLRRPVELPALEVAA